MSLSIQVRDLVVDYGPARILDGLSLEVRQGEIFGFIGPNGAGKSTTIKTLLGLIFPKSGSVLIHGQDPKDPRTRQNIGFLPEEAHYYPYLTPREILSFYGKISGLPCRGLGQKVKNILDKVGILKFQNKRIGTFSKGMTQKVSLAQALIHDPKTLILDEPTSGLDPLSRSDLRDLLLELKKNGKTVFFSSHELSEVELLCDGVAMLKAGKIVLSGPVHQVISGSENNLEKLFVKLMRS